MDPGGPAFPARVAEERNRVWAQELTEVEERVRAELARKAKGRELEAWGQVKISSPVESGTQSEEMVDTRWALT